MNNNWKLSDIPDLNEKVYVVTGANTGMGLQSVKSLAKAGASVVLACRNLSLGTELARSIVDSSNNGDVKAIQLDLINAHSIKKFSDAIYSNYSRLDGLINNAGVVNLAKLSHTAEGLEMHMATNHFGHFALTGHLFELLTATQHSKVVTVSSGGYRNGVIDFDDLDWHKRPYSRLKAYGDSKLANLLLMKALQTRFDIAKTTSLSVAAHPGLTATERQQTIGV